MHAAQRARLRRLVQCKFRAGLLHVVAPSLDGLRDAGSHAKKRARSTRVPS
ncbi:hypothetical protein K788_0004955 [Paraburkholderia caribensis MBA4]|uniref:Uncharacterized protein n=1 Tax=Paraburkholderia caribensis MBA4 TaxID=1323664 RepID=A0A0P0R7Q9_9BURK|nr:hypothetical protein K788_0004955 [Paraburkholderia caribensis MBA4]